MENVHPDNEFRFKDGKAAKNIWDLRKGLQNMVDEEYAEHATADKNDFAEWVEHAVKDSELASKLRGATSRMNAAEIVNTKIQAVSLEIGKSHIVSDFDLIKDFIIGLVIGLIVGAALGYFVLA